LRIPVMAADHSWAIIGLTDIWVSVAGAQVAPALAAGGDRGRLSRRRRAHGVLERRVRTHHMQSVGQSVTVSHIPPARQAGRQAGNPSSYGYGWTT
jgi:hypothetical protein